MRCHSRIVGKSSKLGLTGRPSEFVGILTTSKLYALGEHTLTFFPQVRFLTLSSFSPQTHLVIQSFYLARQMVDPTQFYLSLDPQLFIDSFKAELQFVSNSWKMVGRPTIIFPVGRSLLGLSTRLLPSVLFNT